MADSSAGRDCDFNPLSAWLGFPANALPRDYYSLLGLKPHESDVHEINRAAETLIAHVREIRPGPYLTEWTQLLDILRAAKSCLCDPDKKRLYDEALRNHRITSLMPAPDSLLGHQPSGSRAVVGGELPASLTTSATPQTLETKDHVFENPPAEVETIHFGPSPTWVRQRRKSSLLARVCAVGFLILATTLAYQMFTAPESWRPRLQTVIGVALRSGEMPNSSSATSDSIPGMTHGEQSRETSITTGPHAETDSPKRGDTTPLQPDPGADKSLAGQQVPLEEGPQAEVPVSHPSQAGAAPEPGGPMPGEGEPGPPSTLPSASAPDVVMAPPQNTAEQHGPPQNELPATPDPRRNETTPHEELRLEFRVLITELWQAMSKRELEEARASLNRLAAEVRNDSERRAVESLDYLLRHVEEFWRALYRIVPSMKAGEELAIGDTYIVVVDVTADELVIRAAGQNRRYRIRELPTPLIRIIVARRFRPGPEADAAFGAFLAVDPRGDPREAEQLWRRADDDVLDADILLEALKFRPPVPQ